jgi:predicted O-methyltransferase YrrM
LDALIDDGRAESFDFAFIDADKGNYDAYYERCLTLVRPGGVIAVDNVIWGGSIIDPQDTDPSTEAIRALNAKIGKDDRVQAMLLAIGDGVTLAVKNARGS